MFMAGLLMMFFSACMEHSRSLRQTDLMYFSEARRNAVMAREGIRRCVRFVDGWLDHADPESGLIPKNLHQDSTIWNAKDAAADNVPFMVLTACVTHDAGTMSVMEEMLENERRLTTRMGKLPDVYSFVRNGFLYDHTDTSRIVFGASEYVKDGLLPLTEWMGPSKWSERMLEILDEMIGMEDILVRLPGMDPVRKMEVHGEMLQALSRIYWMTGDRKYLRTAFRIGDHYLLAGNHPTDDMQRLRLRDHGCEVVSGLCEVYFAARYADQKRYSEYRESVHRMLDRILAVGRNEDGLFYNEINPQTGEILRKGIADTWGYTFNGYYTVFMLDVTRKYLDAIRSAIPHLNAGYRSYAWEGESADGYADAIESGLNIYNRIRDPELGEWIDSEIKVMWEKQQPDGIIEGWHGDGNFARTAIMHALWKTGGVTLDPWREDILYGSAVSGDTLFFYLRSGTDWEGRVIFDFPRHREIMGLPEDYPRINQFPEWWTVERESEYQWEVMPGGSRQILTGDHLTGGILLVNHAGDSSMIKIFPVTGDFQNQK